MAATLLTVPATPAFLMPLGAVGNDDGINLTRTKGGTNKVCTGKWIAQMGEKAHSALLNCSPNDRRTSVRPRPFPRHQLSGTIRRLLSAPLTLRVLGLCSYRRRPRPGRDEVGRKLASVSLANRPALQTGLLDDTGRRRSLGGTCSRLRRGARLDGALRPKNLARSAL